MIFLSTSICVRFFTVETFGIQNRQILSHEVWDHYIIFCLGFWLIFETGWWWKFRLSQDLTPKLGIALGVVLPLIEVLLGNVGKNYLKEDEGLPASVHLEIELFVSSCHPALIFFWGGSLGS